MAMVKVNRQAVQAVAKAEEKKAPEFELIEELATLKEGKVPVKFVYGAWNGNDPKFEIRMYKEVDGQMVPTKGIGLDQAMLIKLYDAITEILE